MNSTLAKLEGLFQEIFDDDDLTITRQSTAKDVDGWDSLMHVTLVVQVEKAFGVKFTSSEVAGLKNVGDLVDLVDRKPRKS
jgi:acyl carrier protein